MSATGCIDLCASCSSAVKTFANLQVVGDEKYLLDRWMPPGGCTCLSTAVDPSCPLCFAAELICKPCGATTTPTDTSPSDGAREDHR